MSIRFEERPSDSPLVEKVLHGWTLADGTPTRPAETGWHLVFVRVQNQALVVLTGPLTSAGVATYGAGAEVLWVKFRLGVFMPHLPPRQALNRELFLPQAGSRSFWLKGSAVPFPSFENVETFVSRLAREEVLVSDPVVEAHLQGHTLALSPRTLRHHFLQATGQTQAHIRQYQRAQKAADLLARGESILDVVFALDYFDQPHLTRSVKRFVGRTPGELSSA